VQSSLESVLAFDVGGSHVSAALWRAGAYSLGPVVSEPHPQVQTSGAFVGLLERLAHQAGFTREQAAGVMLAVPGPFDLAAGISRMQHKLPYLYGIDLRRELAARLGCEPCRIRFLNDADAFLLGEVGAGSARGFGRAVGLTLGTGIGSAFAVDTRLVHEGPGVPREGEIWNLPYEGAMVEDFVSTRAIVASYKRRTGMDRQVIEIAAAAHTDPAARAAFEDMGRHLGRVIRTLLDEFRPGVVVLGGGIARSAGLFLPATESELPGSAIQLRISELLDRAALAGCGVAWFQRDSGVSLSTASSAGSAI
jgi:glucokinase